MTENQTQTISTEFMFDHRKTNPTLHLLYVKTAVQHLLILDSFLVRLHNLANLNLVEAISALSKERERLVKTNAAYADAQEIIEIMNQEFSGFKGMVEFFETNKEAK